MIDGEVLRLRKLRNIALRSRALAKTFDSGSVEERSVFARSALLCWTIARIASGRLKAHPYANYQSGPTWLSTLADGLYAAVVAFSARRRNRSLSVYAEQLQVLAREVGDVRSLTWSQDLGDALGRMQAQISRLAHEFDLGVLSETAGATSEPHIAAPESHHSSWPYLAIQ